LSYFPRIVALRGGAVAFDAKADTLSRDALEDFYLDERALAGGRSEKEWRPTPV
jgi:ABC-type phosphate/phosphonate transport system ATPase subunit